MLYHNSRAGLTKGKKSPKTDHEELGKNKKVGFIKWAFNLVCIDIWLKIGKINHDQILKE